MEAKTHSEESSLESETLYKMLPATQTSGVLNGFYLEVDGGDECEILVLKKQLRGTEEMA